MCKECPINYAKFQRDSPSGSAAIPEKLEGGVAPTPPALARVKPNRAPLEQVRAPDQQPTEPFVYMGPLELDGAQMKSQMAPREGRAS